MTAKAAGLKVVGDAAEILTPEDLRIRTGTITVQVVRLSNKQLTLATFRQILEENPISPGGLSRGVPLGYVNHHWGDQDRRHPHALFQNAEGKLRRVRINLIPCLPRVQSEYESRVLFSPDGCPLSKYQPCYLHVWECYSWWHPGYKIRDHHPWWGLVSSVAERTLEKPEILEEEDPDVFASLVRGWDEGALNILSEVRARNRFVADLEEVGQIFIAT